jgi:multidrug efflux system membrane fusion protein
MSRFLCLASLVTAAIGCSQHPQPGPPPAPNVTVSLPLRKEVTDYAVYTARTAAVKTVVIIPRVSGYIMNLPFKEGMDVKQDDLLCQIDPRPYQALVDQATAQIAFNESQLKFAQSTLKRDLAANSGSTPLAVSLEQIDQDRATVAQNTASIDLAKAQFETQKLNLGFCRITSPIDGRVSSYFMQVGNLAVQDQSQLTSVVSQDPIYAYFDVDEPTVLRVHELIGAGKLPSIRESGTRIPVSLALSTEKGFPHQGYIDFSNNQFTASTATLRVRGVFANPKPASGERLLTPAMFVLIRVPVSPPHQALLVAQGAVQSDQDLNFVFVVDEKNTLERRNVKLGTVHDGLQEITDGVGANDRIVVNGLQRLHPGVVVDPKLEDMPLPVTTETSKQAVTPVPTQTPQAPARKR